MRFKNRLRSCVLLDLWWKLFTEWIIKMNGSFLKETKTTNLVTLCLSTYLTLWPTLDLEELLFLLKMFLIVFKIQCLACNQQQVFLKLPNIGACFKTKKNLHIVWRKFGMKSFQTFQRKLTQICTKFQPTIINGTCFVSHFKSLTKTSFHMKTAFSSKLTKTSHSKWASLPSQLLTKRKRWLLIKPWSWSISASGSQTETWRR